MEHEGIHHCLHNPAACYYPEPDQSILCPPSHFLYFKIITIFPSRLGSSKWSLSHKSPHQYPVCTSPVIHTCHMPRPSLIYHLYHPNDVVLAVQIINLTVL